MPALITTSAVGLAFDASGSVDGASTHYGNGRSAAPDEANLRTAVLPWGGVRDGDDLGSARGLMFGCMLGALMWVPIIAYFFG
ncbi:hypothetical protein [Rhodopila globiformis]|uniref:Uncharacterized protein n=1 Tax=Rhodopila globiformis TaxID=1071 RepID=A0A2S6MZ33_RHOGL|nr:hypothetical protein [Rhodopila globiformis]PPQ27627.1 hypothetical protein CCS01_26810 [Rhodopila globiformis]